MKLIILISSITIIFGGLIYFEEKKIEETKLLYAYSGKMLERTMVFDFVSNDRMDLLKKYTNRLIVSDIALMNDDQVFNSMIEIGYCRQWKNIEPKLRIVVENFDKNETIQKIKMECKSK